VNFWYSDVVTTPLTFGYFKPVILLPVALVNQISTKEAE
jgi:beta-lactamase regulating signal transducer with metallopeptidase domain